MADFWINFPVRSDDDLVSELAFGSFPARYLEGADLQVVREMAKEAVLATNIQTVGELRRELERHSPQERRQLLDRWRERAGLPTTGQIAKAREHRQMLADDLHPPSERNRGVRREDNGTAYQRCAGCQSWPMTPNGGIMATKANKYWCPACADQAAPGDLDDWKPGPVHIHGHLTPEDEAYYRELEAERRREFERGEAEKEAEAEAIKEAGERWQEEGEISVLGHRVRPGAVRIQ